MKETTKTSRVAGQLEKMFRALNTDLFNGEVEEPIITIQSSAGAYGHVSVAKTWKKKEDEKHELNISAEHLKRPIEDITATMIHEMTHLINMQKGIQDVSRGGMYHNKKFKEEAEKHLIRIEHHEKYGWTITRPTDELLEYIIEKEWSEISIGKESYTWTPKGTGTGTGSTTGKGTAPKKSSTRKLQCPCCKNSVRATKEVNVICGDCMEKMIEI